MNNLPRLLAVVGGALLALAAHGQSQLVVENFDGSSSANLDGITADTFAAAITSAGGNATWHAASGSHIRANGDLVVPASTQGSAYLHLGNFINNAKGAADAKFTLTATLTKPTAATTVSVGFFEESANDDSLVGLNFTSTTHSGYATAVHRYSETSTTANFFAGPEANVANNPGNLTGMITFKIELDFTPAGGYNGTTNHGTVRFYDPADLGTVSFSHTYTSAISIGGVGIGYNGGGSVMNANVSAFSLVQGSGSGGGDAIAAPDHVLGVNLAGADSSQLTMPGTYGTHYIYPGVAQFDYYDSKGVKLIRLPFRWERVQRTLGGNLDANEITRIRNVLTLAENRGMAVILDMHNYAKYRIGGTNHVIDATNAGTVTLDHFTNVWTRLANEFKNRPGVYGYGIMNEPTGVADTWPQIAQAAVNAIRTTDTNTHVFISGIGNSNALRWVSQNPDLDIADPADRLFYEAHCYFSDTDNDEYVSYANENGHPFMGVEKVSPFIQWLQKKNARGFIGEYGVPRNDSRWNTVLENFLDHLKDNGVIGTYWTGGPWVASDYQLSCEPNGGVDRPQMSVIQANTIGLGGVGVGDGLRGFYYTNPGLTGTVVHKLDPQVNFNWGTGAPTGTGFDADTWSIRWVGKIKAPATGTYTFFVNMNDGARLWVNGKLLVDSWTNKSSPVEQSGTVFLREGLKYDIRLEYYENTGGALAELRWQGPSVAKQIVPSAQLYADGDGLKATYYDNIDFTGASVHGVDSLIFKLWDNNAPKPGISVGTFSVTWQGFVRAPVTGTYTFKTITDDGARLRINGQLLIDNLTTGGVRTNTATIALSAGQFYPITLDYTQNSTKAEAKFYWSHTGTEGWDMLVPEEALFSSQPSVTPGVDLGE